MIHHHFHLDSGATRPPSKTLPHPSHHHGLRAMYRRQSPHALITVTLLEVACTGAAFSALPRLPPHWPAPRAFPIPETHQLAPWPSSQAPAILSPATVWVSGAALRGASSLSRVNSTATTRLQTTSQNYRLGLTVPTFTLQIMCATRAARIK